ncbi:MAG: zinc ribbon domain-containing protein [Anaerolineae bacterium]|nr:zinc ribbon domain-containing protein [Anaerolineae bacterium]
MPAYDYRCKDCGHRFTLTYKSIAVYIAAAPQCPKCTSPNLARVINRVRMLRSDESRVESLESLPGLAAFDDLDNADPRAVGRMMRRMSDEIGEDLGPEMDEVVGRLEAGESPESIETQMGDVLSDAPGGPLDDV